MWKVSPVFDMLLVHMLNIKVRPNMLQLMKLIVSGNIMHKIYWETASFVILWNIYIYIYTHTHTHSKVLFADKHMTTHTSVTVLTLRTENVGQKVFSSSSVVYDVSHTKTTHCCTSVRQNWKVMSENLRKTLELKWTCKWTKKLCF